jgi:acetaldehyde dehydrogenase (acetylating)
MHAVSVAVVGAGETGTPLLEVLLKADFVNVLGVADLDPEQPGMVLARKHAVRTTGRFLDLAELGNKVDIIIDVTGVPVVRDELRRHLEQSQNSHTILMHERIVMLVLSLISGRLIEMKHGEQDYK